MSKIFLILFLTLTLKTQGTRTPQNFQFKNDPAYQDKLGYLISYLPKNIMDQPDFQLRLWYPRVEGYMTNDHYGLLLISHKGQKWKASNIHFSKVKRTISKGKIYTSMKIDLMPLQKFDVAQEVNTLFNEGLATAQTLSEEEIYRLAVSRGYDTRKGFSFMRDGFEFEVELLSKNARRAFKARYPNHYYEKTSKLIPELVPLIKVQCHLFDLAGVGIGL